MQKGRQNIEQSSITMTSLLNLGKGIETVRRDGCAVVSKVLESALKILFRTKDVSLVKSYVQKQMAKTIDGRTPMQVRREPYNFSLSA